VIFYVSISVRQRDAGDSVASPLLENWPLLGQKFSTFRHIIQLHAHLSEVLSFLPSTAKSPILPSFCLWLENRNCL